MKILIADDQTNVRYGLTVLLEEQTEVEILGDATSFKELLHQILKECPDIILLSWDLPDLTGENLIQSMCLICPDVHIVVMGSSVNVADQALEAGAKDYVSKTEPPERLLNVIRQYANHNA